MKKAMAENEVGVGNWEETQILFGLCFAILFSFLSLLSGNTPAMFD